MEAEARSRDYEARVDYVPHKSQTHINDNCDLSGLDKAGRGSYINYLT